MNNQEKENILRLLKSSDQSNQELALQLLAGSLDYKSNDMIMVKVENGDEKLFVVRGELSKVKTLRNLHKFSITLKLELSVNSITDINNMVVNPHQFVFTTEVNNIVYKLFSTAYIHVGYIFYGWILTHSQVHMANKYDETKFTLKFERR